MAGTFQVGDVILGKYEITRVLGKGGMGMVVAALHRELDGLVALKFLLPSYVDSPQSCERFAREARTGMRIKNEHVARVFDVGTVEGAPFMVMEYLTGQDLSQVIAQRGPLPIAETVDLLLQACEAVADAHKLGIVHRDLKPANIFVTTGSDDRPFIKVLDFGISKSTALSDLSFTASAAVVGSPLYMSPEQLATSGTADPRTDVWALGVILYEMLAGVTPFTGETFATLSAAIFRGTYAKVSTYRPDVPAALEGAMGEALQRDAEARLPSVEAFASRIAPFGSNAARHSYERIQRISQREPPPALPLPLPGALDAAMASEPPSTILRAAQAAAVVLTGPGLSRSVAPVERRPLRWRRPAAGVAAGLAVLCGFVVLWPRVAHIRQPAAPVCALDADTDNACHQCRDESCCEIYLACHNSSACGDYLDCTTACKTTSCKLECAKTHSEGHAIAGPYLACSQAHCAGPCGASEHASACQYCEEASCQAQSLHCTSDPACDTLRTCVTACRPGDDGCARACKDAAPSAARPLFDAMVSCAFTYCGTACSQVEPKKVP